MILSLATLQFFALFPMTLFVVIAQGFPKSLMVVCLFETDRKVFQGSENIFVFLKKFLKYDGQNI